MVCHMSDTPCCQCSLSVRNICEGAEIGKGEMAKVVYLSGERERQVVHSLL